MNRLLLLFFFLPFGLFAQSEEVLLLQEIGERIMMERDEKDRLDASDAFRELLIDVLQNAEDAFSVDFTEVKNLSNLSSDDGKVRIFTWLVPGPPGTERFNGMLMVRKKKKDFTLYQLDDVAESLAKPEYMLLNTGRWYGVLYYQLFTVTDKKETYYMLMGYKPIDDKIQQKVIDVLHFEKDDVPRFGAKIFETPKLMDRVYERPPYRLFFNYSARVSASFRYLEKENMIVLDHLAPPEGHPLGKWEMYGPDFSYDGLEFDKGKWILVEGVSFDSGLKQQLPPTAPKKDERTGKIKSK